MDGNHPKRRKDKYNPYTIGTTGDGRHWLTFSDGQGNRHLADVLLSATILLSMADGSALYQSKEVLLW